MNIRTLKGFFRNKLRYELSFENVGASIHVSSYFILMLGIVFIFWDGLQILDRIFDISSEKKWTLHLAFNIDLMYQLHCIKIDASIQNECAIQLVPID